jgi:PhzF family phenazine biosynthesis protein
MTSFTTESNTLSRLSAFTDNPNGGNPAGVWIGDKLPEPRIMQQIAKQVGYSETAFIAPRMGNKRHVRYFSPEAEVPFCGHATIASGVALGEANGDNTYFLDTAVGEIPVTVSTENGVKTASLISVAPKYEPAPETLLNDALNALGWSLEDLDFSIPPARAFAGNWHLVIAVKLQSRLDNLQYDFDELKTLMLDDDLTTLQLIWRENAEVIHSRNPFPVGGVIEDPATGAAAAALGGYLREAKLVIAPRKFIIRQGEVMGRPSLLKLEIPSTGGIMVSGTAVQLDEAKKVIKGVGDT